MMAVSLPSRVRAVTVYRKGAEVTRVAVIEAGSAGFAPEVELTGLPLALEDATVRASIEKAQGAWVRQVKVGLGVRPPTETLRPPEDAELEAARIAERLVASRLEQRRVELGRVSTLRIPPRPPGARGERPPPSPVEARLALLAFQSHHVESLRKEIAELEARLEDAARARKDLEEQERRATTARAPRPDELRKVVRVSLGDVAATVGSTCELVVRYRVPGARWAPAYSLELDPALRTGTLTIKAAVAQQSAEDWTNVELIVSTARPQDWHDLPEPRSLRIGRRQAPVVRRFRPPPRGAEVLFEDYDRAAREEGVAPPPQPRPAPKTVDALEAAADVAVVRAKVRGRVAMPMSMPARSFAAQAVPAEPPPAPEPPEDVLDDALLDYASLRMAGPSEAQRGHLQRVVSSMAFEDLGRLEPEALVELAEQRALDTAALPPGHAVPVPEGGFDYAYPAERPVDVASDGAFHTIVLRTSAVEFERRFVAVPSESPQVFRTLVLENPIEGALLEGPLDVLVGRRFLLAATVPETAPGGKVRLGLGVEQQVKIARNASFREESTGLLQGALDLQHEIRIEVTNLRPDAAVVELRERVPVRKEKESDVRITEGPCEPPWSPWKPETGSLEGGRVWIVTVAPGDSAQLVGRYTVRIPTKHELVGGNRRS
jgi:hypothetical protein